MTTPARAAALLRIEASRQRLRQELTTQAARPSLMGALMRAVQDHPLSMALAAGLLGATVMRARPWRWLRGANTGAALHAVLLAAIGPALAAAQAALPAGTWSEALSALWREIVQDRPAQAADQPAPAAPKKA